MAINTINTKNLRAKILQHIVASRFDATFGTNWWKDVLLFHMREEAQVPKSIHGSKYSLALKKYGRMIELTDLDTTVTSTIILYDPYFKTGPAPAGFTQDEIDTTKNLHLFRNKLSHEEADPKKLEEAEKRSLRVMREAVDKLNLTETNPTLAKAIIDEYMATFSEADGETGSADFMALSARFEEAENLFNWEVDKAVPIYEELAAKGFKAAQKRLFEIYTHTVKQFDLSKALEVANAYPDILAENDRQKLAAMNAGIVHVLWGTPNVCETFSRELSDGTLIRNAQILQYIQSISDAFPNGLLGILNKDPDNLTEYVKLMQIPPNMQTASNSIYVKALIRIARNTAFDFNHTKSVLAQVAAMGYVPLIEYFVEESVRRGIADKAGDRERARIRTGHEKGSSICTQWLQRYDSPQKPKVVARFKEESTPHEGNEPSGTTEVQALKDSILKLTKKNARLKFWLVVACIGDGALLLAWAMTMLAH